MLYRRVWTCYCRMNCCKTIKVSLTFLWKAGRMSPDGEMIRFGLGLKLGGPKRPLEQTVPYIQDGRTVSEIVIESGREADGLHAAYRGTYFSVRISLCCSIENLHRIFMYDMQESVPTGPSPSVKRIMLKSCPLACSSWSKRQGDGSIHQQRYCDWPQWWVGTRSLWGLASSQYLGWLKVSFSRPTKQQFHLRRFCSQMALMPQLDHLQSHCAALHSSRPIAFSVASLFTNVDLLICGCPREFRALSCCPTVVITWRYSRIVFSNISARPFLFLFFFLLPGPTSCTSMSSRLHGPYFRTLKIAGALSKLRTDDAIRFCGEHWELLWLPNWDREDMFDWRRPRITCQSYPSNLVLKYKLFVLHRRNSHFSMAKFSTLIDPLKISSPVLSMMRSMHLWPIVLSTMLKARGAIIA